MALTGIEIFKRLPKKNCGECGVPTCLAFAMSLAAGKAELSACPYVTEEAKQELSEASAPPIRPLTVGSGDSTLKIGGETVMFRHEKTFVNPPGLALLLTDAMEEAEIEKKLQQFNLLRYERVGLILRPELIAIKADSGDAQKFQRVVGKVKDNGNASIILMSENPEILAGVLALCKDCRPLLYAATKDNWEKLAELAKQNSCPLAVRGDNLAELADLTTKLTQAGLNDLVLDSGARTPQQLLKDQTIIRRAALVKKFRPLGFPTITFPCEVTDNLMEETMVASMMIAKYAGIIVLSDLQGESLFPLLLARMNVYTDPQRPMATTQGIYEIGKPTEQSPVLITTNFSLTYFIVSGEIETSRVPCWLLVQDTEGLSVMTAWAADKFVAETIAIFVKKSGIADRVKHRKLIVPGYVAQISGELEEELPDWQIVIGPRESAHIPALLKNWKPD